MATMILLPDGENNVSSDWIAVGETLIHTTLKTDDAITSYAKCDDINEAMIIEFADPDDVTTANSGVAEADIASINSVRFLSSGKSAHRSNTTRCTMLCTTPSGNSGENAVYNAHRTNFTTVNGTALSYSDGSSAAWTYANLGDLVMRCTLTSSVESYVSYLAIEVTYTSAVSADNATFFGTNF